MSDTALHKAVKCHSTKSCLACVKQLIKHGATLELQVLPFNDFFFIAMNPEKNMCHDYF